MAAFAKTTFNKVAKLSGKKNILKGMKLKENIGKAAGGIKNNYTDIANRAKSELKGRKLFTDRAHKREAMNRAESSFLNRMDYKNPSDLKTAAKIKANPLKRVSPEFSNLYSGYEVHGGVDKTLAAGVMGFAVGTAAIKGAYFDESKGTAPPEPAGNMQGLSYDGVANASAGRKDLGATGELVFGLHNQRKG